MIQFKIYRTYHDETDNRKVAQAHIKPAVKEYKETHQYGHAEIMNLHDTFGWAGIGINSAHNGDFGIQIAADGRVWVCIDGIAFLRFTPQR